MSLLEIARQDAQLDAVNCAAAEHQRLRNELKEHLQVCLLGGPQLRDALREVFPSLCSSQMELASVCGTSSEHGPVKVHPAVTVYGEVFLYDASLSPRDRLKLATLHPSPIGGRDWTRWLSVDTAARYLEVRGRFAQSPDHLQAVLRSGVCLITAQALPSEADLDRVALASMPSPQQRLLAERHLTSAGQP